MLTQKKRKNTSFRLQGELLPLSLKPSFNLCISFSLSSSPPLTTAPAVSTRNPQAVHRQEKFPKCFPIIAFCLSFTSCPLFLYCFLLFFGGRFSQAACSRWRNYPVLILSLTFGVNAWKSVYLPWLLSYMSPSSSSLLFRLQADTQTHTISPLFTHTSTNTWSYVTSTRCLKIQTPLNFRQCLHVSSVSSNVNAL